MHAENTSCFMDEASKPTNPTNLTYPHLGIYALGQLMRQASALMCEGGMHYPG